MSDLAHRDEVKKEEPRYNIAAPHHLSKRSKWLRDYYFKGVDREWILQMAEKWELFFLTQFVLQMEQI